jgi:dephospho-CoA kinase
VSGDNMKVIGITGGIASGKSYVSSVVKKSGYPVIDADHISKELSEKDKPVYNAIVRTFGESYLDENKNLDRQKLASLIFNDKQAKGLLNGISHPLIIDEMERQIKNAESDLVFVDVPLLYESHIENMFDKIVCVYLPRTIQIERLMKRDNITYEYAVKKIESQKSLEEKKNLADFVINSSNSFDSVDKSVIELIKTLKEV